MTREKTRTKVKKLQTLIHTLCGIYSRVAPRLGVHRTFVSRVARGERHSAPVEQALIKEYERVKERGDVSTQE